MSIIDKIATKVTVKTPTVASPIEPVVSCDYQLLEAFKSMLMQTPDELRREIINEMSDKHKAALLSWLDSNCGVYSYHIIKDN